MELKLLLATIHDRQTPNDRWRSERGRVRPRCLIDGIKKEVVKRMKEDGMREKADDAADPTR